MTTSINRHYLRHYLTFYYEYLPRIEAAKAGKAEEEEEETEVCVNED